jgi:hypothetical protein
MEFIITSILIIQALVIAIGSVFVLQSTLSQCSAQLRLAFVIFPIGASMEIVDVLSSQQVHASQLVLNAAILMVLSWLWFQRDLINEVSKMIPKTSTGKYSFFNELRVLASCFGIWIIKKTNKDGAVKCIACETTL